MTTRWQPYREPLRATLARTITIALIIGALVARWWGGGLRGWPLATLLMLWPSFGGHWIELWFLNWLRPRLSSTRAIQVGARLVVWFVGGIVLALGMAVSAALVGRFQPARWPAWWLAGLAFIGLELIIQFAIQLRRRPSFYNGRG